MATWRKILNKYPAMCSRCRTKLERGALVWYDRNAGRGRKIRCLECGAGADAVPAASPARGADLAGAIAAAVGPLLQAAVDEGQVRSIVDDAVGPAVAAAVERIGVRRVEIRVPDRPVVDATGQHELFSTLLACLAAREPVWLIGPAGGGKSHAVRAAAEALGLAFASMPLGPDTSSYEVTGHRSATGEYITTAFRKCYEDGGVLLVDEADAAAPGAMLPINDALSNGRAGFPDGMVQRHPDFCCVAAANTYGLGANRVYVGRSQQDATFLDRFVFLEWGYDEELERRLAGDDQQKWCAYVQACRHSADRLGVRHVISPRATLKGANLLRAGLGRSEVERMALWKGLDADSIAKIKTGVA